MKKAILSMVKTALFAVAVFAAATPSQVGSYQKECPESLKKYHF